ncbi:DUF559 domain-containing protein [Labrys sp. KNU-23]|uniref:endonuclease domain-containing protein n=1 Tax=Labrys sp. KNU-23 TaxID=2789216 RepID=UPI0011EC4820|nr:DUF559 domain-containing protein [Labrys sp. KNU-23]QEN85362.1 DUF559 domain-containing protein [Labrys sp. KNU-23]
MEDPRPYRYSSRKFARERRRLMTKSESMLWWELRSGGVGVKFRRQMPIGPYTVDFASHEVALVVEVDGRTHENEEAAAYDRERQAWLERQGWRVLRLPDDLVIGSLQLAVDRIKAPCVRLTK